MHVARFISYEINRFKKSILLLGPRQTGKSTLIKSLSPEFCINLAKESTFLKYSRDPDLLEQEIISKEPKTVFIDEVQRLAQ